MKKKNIAMVILFNFFIISASSFSMDYMRDTYNTTTMRIAQNLINARNWTTDFLDNIRLKFYALLRIESLKRITGLDENKLDTYKPYELDVAKDQIGKMIEYGYYESPYLNKLYMELQGKIQSAEHKREIDENEQADIDAIDAAYDEDTTAKDIDAIYMDNMLKSQKR